MIDLQELCERIGIGACLICESTVCYMVEENDKKAIESLYRKLISLFKDEEFEGGIFKKNGKTFAILKIENCVLITPVAKDAGVFYYKLKRALEELK